MMPADSVTLPARGGQSRAAEPKTVVDQRMPLSRGPLALALLAALWAGLILGVSFLATIAKFQAPSLPLPVALDVGRHTFRWLTTAQRPLAAVALLALGIVKPSRTASAAWLLMLAGLALEAFWLLPALDARVTVMQRGGVPAPSMHHALFVVVESVRAVTLLCLAAAPLLSALRAGRVHS